MKKSQDDRFTIGVKCAAPDCDRTVLLASSYCTTHKPHRPSSSPGKKPVIPNSKRRLLGAASKLVARKSESILRSGYSNQSSVSRETPRVPESSEKGIHDSQQRYKGKQVAVDEEEEPIPRDKSTQARNRVIQNALETNGKTIAQPGPAKTQPSFLSQSDDKRKDGQPDKERSSVKSGKLPASAFESVARSAGLKQSSDLFKSRSKESRPKLAHQHSKKESNYAAKVSSETRLSAASSRGLPAPDSQKVLESVPSTDLVKKPKSPPETTSQPTEKNTLRDDSIAFLPTESDSPRTPQVLGKRKVYDIGPDVPVEKVAAAKTLPIDVTRAQVEKVASGTQAVSANGGLNDGIDTEGGETIDGILSSGQSIQPNAPGKQIRDSPNGEADVSGLEVGGQDTQVRDETVKQDLVANDEGWDSERRFAFDSNAFDAMIYQQSSINWQPSLPFPPRRSLKGELPRSLLVNPAIHGMHNRSEHWYQKKHREIAARRGRKAWFGKPVERMKWLEAQEVALEEERQKAERNGAPSFRKDPQPKPVQRILDFGDIPEQDLPEDVRNNPGWLKACAFMRQMSRMRQPTQPTQPSQPSQPSQPRQRGKRKGVKKGTLKKPQQRQSSDELAAEELNQALASLVDKGQRREMQ